MSLDPIFLLQDVDAFVVGRHCPLRLLPRVQGVSNVARVNVATKQINEYRRANVQGRLTVFFNPIDPVLSIISLAS